MTDLADADDLSPLPATPLGRYRHYKGGEYEVIGVARHSETNEPLVVYRPLYNASGWMYKLDQGRTFAWSAEQDAKVSALTVDQVNAAIRKWIVPGRINWSVGGTFDDKK